MLIEVVRLVCLSFLFNYIIVLIVNLLILLLFDLIVCFINLEVVILFFIVGWDVVSKFVW